MGSAIWVNYGIGVCTTDLKIKSTKSVAKLISLAPDFNEYVKQVFAAIYQNQHWRIIWNLMKIIKTVLHISYRKSSTNLQKLM